MTEIIALRRSSWLMVTRRTNYHDIPQVLHRRKFNWWEDYIQGASSRGIWYPKNFNNIRVAWLDQYCYLTCFKKLPSSVPSALNRWKVDMISDPYKYMLLIVGFYQRSVPFFLYVFQCYLYLEDLPIGNMVSCCSFTGGINYMDDRNYSFKKIFMAHGD